jgi:DNA-binding NarL/FixJ family response regulator
MTTCRVLLVDDQQLVVEGLTRILGTDPTIEIVGACRDGDEVEATVARLEPDVVVMDMRMKRVDGAEATRRLRDREGSPPVLALTTFDDDEVVAAALGAGAAGFIVKDAPGEDLIRAVREIADGGAWLDPSVTGRVLETYRTTVLPRADASARVEELSGRETEVLRLVARGASNAEIAEALVISQATVKSHVTNILMKLDLRDRAAAIVFAFDHGLIEPGAPS